MRALLPAEALRKSWALLLLRPIATLSLALSLLTSLFAVCCGLGVIAAPWFGCELLALQLGELDGAPPARRVTWLVAGSLQLVGLVLLCALSSLGALSLAGIDEVDFLSLDASRLALLAPSLVGTSIAHVLSLALLVHFGHAPAILVDRGGSALGAMLESARLVHVTGVVRSAVTSAASYVLELLPAVLGIGVALSCDTLAAMIACGLVLLPVAALCIALGQGMRAASYLALRAAVPRHPRKPPRPVRSGLCLAFVALALVLLGPVLVTFSLWKPAQVATGTLSDDREVLLEATAESSVRERYLADTALRLAISDRRVRVLASDGGGAGTLPLPRGSIAEVRVARAVQRGSSEPGPSVATFSIEVRMTDGRVYLTSIDEAGVRLEDTLTLRLAERLPRRGRIALFAVLVWAALWIARALPPQGALLRTLTTAEDPEGVRTLRGLALVSALRLAPAALASVGIALWALLG